MRTLVPVNALSRAGWLLASMPAAAFLVFVSLAAHIRLRIGRFPAYGTYNPVAPDPIAAHDSLTQLGLLLAAASTLSWPIVAIALFLRGQRDAALRQTLLLAAGLAALVLVYVTNPFGFPEWFLD
jgi:hypothetical protein